MRVSDNREGERTIVPQRTPSTFLLLEIILPLAALPCLNAGSLRGTIMDETFLPQPDVSVNLSSEGNVEVQRKARTDRNGVFAISDLPAGKYTVRADLSGFISVEVHNILIGDREDLQLRRILLETGELFGNCVVRINAKSDIQHAVRTDIQIAGRVLVRRSEIAVVKLLVFAERELAPIELIPTDKKGHFVANITMAGDIRLQVGLQNRNGETVIPEQELNLGWAELGESISLPNIRLNRLGLGHFCY
jgi:hypothetical protein